MLWRSEGHSERRGFLSRTFEYSSEEVKSSLQSQARHVILPPGAHFDHLLGKNHREKAMMTRGMITGSVARPRSRKLILGIVSIIVTVVVVLSVLLAYYSPHYSWSSSIRDHDDDGVPDNGDPRPFDPDIWTYGSATINLTIHNNLSEGADFNIYVMWAENYEHQYTSQPQIPGNDVFVKTFNVSWLMGQNDTEWWIWLSASRIEEHYGVILDLGIFVTHDGQILNLSVTCPDDFQPWPSLP